VAIKRGLGKGLSALLPDEAAENSTVPEGKQASQIEKKEGIEEPGRDTKERTGEILIATEKLKANPNQPRKNFNEEELAELSDSIRQQGIIQPIIAEDAGDGTYTIIAGERRARAAKIAGLDEVPVVLRRYSDEKRMVVSLIENIQRANLNPIEEAQAYKQIMDMESLSQEDVASRVGKNRATVSNALRLLKLPVEMQESIKKNELSPGHGRAVLSVSGAKAQEALFREIIRKGLSVREAEKRAAAFDNRNKKQKKAAKGRAPELITMEEKFMLRLGTKTIIKGDLNKGSVVIDYYSMEDLDRLYEILG
jgi:ParB family chromosome partitioning protein